MEETVAIQQHPQATDSADFDIDVERYAIDTISPHCSSPAPLPGCWPAGAT